MMPTVLAIGGNVFGKPKTLRIGVGPIIRVPGNLGPREIFFLKRPSYFHGNHIWWVPRVKYPGGYYPFQQRFAGFLDPFSSHRGPIFGG